MELLLVGLLLRVLLSAAQHPECSDGGRRLACQERCGWRQTRVERACPGGRVCCRRPLRDVYRPLRPSGKPRRTVPPNSGPPKRQGLAPDSGFVFPTSHPAVILNIADFYQVDRPAPQVDPRPPARKSAKYCKEYTKVTTEHVYAMPLLPQTRPFTIEVENCPPRFTPLIVGGKPVSQGEFPHMAAIGFLRSDEIDYLCGGTLISDRFVLTAAHCSNTRWGPPAVVHLGSAELYSENATVVGVEDVVVHPKYKPPSVYHDIALVKVKRSLRFDLNLRPACLPSPMTKAQVPGALTLATGWGKLGFGRESSVDLMKVALKVIHNYKCKEFYSSDVATTSLSQGITPTMMCAQGYKAKYHDTCQGDSGGALQALVAGSECMMEVVGVTSFGKSCGTGVPGVYTRVASYLDWIESVVWPE